MSLLDWTRSVTTSKPDIITISWINDATATQAAEERSERLQSTTTGVSQSTYQTFAYIDGEGKQASQDVVVYKEDVKTTTKASVNQSWITDRLKNNRGLPGGGDSERSVTSYEYRVNTEGPKLIRETTETYISMAAFAGQMQGIPYSWSDPDNPTQNLYFDPPGGEVLSQRTIIEYDESKGADGRDYTRTRTSRWIALGAVSEAKESLLKFLKGLADFSILDPGIIEDRLYDHTELKFEGTEVQVNIGRAPVPAKPSDAELAADEVAKGSPIPSGATPADVYGNDKGWTGYVPDDIDWTTLNQDSDGDGIPDWAPYVPDQWEDYNQDSNGDGIPDWADYVPTDWQFYDADSNGDGIPDWADYVPTDWQDFNQDTDGNGVPDWADYVPTDWQDFNQDTDGNGVPDWADYVPTDWQDYVTDPGDWENTAIDTDGDGTPDWADYVPTDWQDYVTDPGDWENTAVDSNGDGIPDWADYVPTDWQDYDQDSNSDGVPDWADYVPTDWQDYVTDPTDWENTAIDSNGDGIPDWADNTPIGWEEFDTDTDYSNPDAEVNNDKSITGQVVFDGQSYNDGSATVTATYQMPFAPDDYFYYEKGIRKLYRSGAQQAAIRFGQTEAALDIGHAFGQNIVTNFDLTPTLDLSPVYIRLAGIEGAFLLDAPSYAWGPEGMVVSSDLLLLGVTGYDGISAPATSWLRLPVATAGIGPASGTTVEASPVKANSINIPGGFDVRNLSSVFAALPTDGADVFPEWKSNAALVPPSLTLERETIAAGPSLRVVELDYALDAGTDAESIATGPTIDFIWITQVTPPIAAVTVTGIAPAVSTGARVSVPVAAVSVAGVAPALATGVTVAVPTAAVTLAGVAPDLVGRQRTQVLMPVAGLSVTGLAPLVAGGASVAVPAAGVTVAGVVPADIGIVLNSFTWTIANTGNPPADGYRLYSYGWFRLSTTTSQGYKKDKLLLLSSGVSITVIVKGVTHVGTVTTSASLEDAGTPTERVFLIASMSPALANTTTSDGTLEIKSSVF